MKFAITGIVGGSRKFLTSIGHPTTHLAKAHLFDDMSYAELHRNQLAYSGLLKDWSEIKIITFQEWEPTNDDAAKHGT